MEAGHPKPAMRRLTVLMIEVEELEGASFAVKAHKSELLDEAGQ